MHTHARARTSVRSEDRAAGLTHRLRADLGLGLVGLTRCLLPCRAEKRVGGQLRREQPPLVQAEEGFDDEGPSVTACTVAAARRGAECRRALAADSEDGCGGEHALLAQARTCGRGPVGRSGAGGVHVCAGGNRPVGRGHPPSGRRIGGWHSAGSRRGVAPFWCLRRCGHCLAHVLSDGRRRQGRCRREGGKDGLDRGVVAVGRREACGGSIRIERLADRLARLRLGEHTMHRHKGRRRDGREEARAHGGVWEGGDHLRAEGTIFADPKPWLHPLPRVAAGSGGGRGEKAREGERRRGRAREGERRREKVREGERDGHGGRRSGEMVYLSMISSSDILISFCWIVL